MFNPLKQPRTETHTIDNGDGTVTTVTVTFNRNGTKSMKKQTAPKHIPDNDVRFQQSKHARRGSLEEATEAIKRDLKKVLGVGHADDAKFANKVNRAIPAEIVLIASQDDVTQAQESDSARKKYGLPNIPNTKSDSGSLATSALLQLLFEDPSRVLKGHASPWDCCQLLKQIQHRVKLCSSLQKANPVISSSRPLGPPALKKGDYAPFYIVPPGFTGTRRALLICVVNGEGDDLKGPPNDINYIHYFLTKHCGFKEKDIVQLRDDKHAPSSSQRSTKQNILDGFSKMVRLSKPNDVCFFQFSGHGGRLGDNLYILPSDYKKHGQIMDDQILQDLIKHMPEKTHTTMLVDCCYSGVIGDLPYTLQSKKLKGEHLDIEQEIATYYDTKTRQEMIEREKWGDDEDEDWKEKKNARSKWRNITRIATVAKEYAQASLKDAAVAAGHAAGDAKKRASAAAGDAKKRASEAATAAGKAATAAGDKAGQAAANMRNSTTTPTSKEKPQATKSTPVQSASGGSAKSIPQTRSRSNSINSAGSGGSAHSKANGTTDKPKPGKPAQPSVVRPNIKKAPLRRVATAPLPGAKMFGDRPKTSEEINRARSMAAGNSNNQEDEIEITSHSLPSRSRSADYEEEGRRQAVLRSQQEASEARARKAEARRKALERSRAAARAREAKKRPPMKPEVAKAKMDTREYDRWMEAARREAVERSRREAAEARDALNEKEYKEWMEAARREAVERSRREAAEARATMSKKEYQEWMEQARREALERSRQEAEDAKATLDWKEYEEWIEAQRKEAVEKSRIEAEEARRASVSAQWQEYEAYMDEARRQAIERSQKEAAQAHEEAARRAAVGTRESIVGSGGKAPADMSAQEYEEYMAEARREAIERSQREAAQEHEEAARKSAVGKRESVKGPPRRSKSIEELAREREMADRQAAVGKRESVKGPPRRSKSIEEIAHAQEMADRQAAVERSRREAAEMRASVKQ